MNESPDFSLTNNPQRPIQMPKSAAAKRPELAICHEPTCSP